MLRAENRKTKLKKTLLFFIYTNIWLCQVEWQTQSQAAIKQENQLSLTYLSHFPNKRFFEQAKDSLTNIHSGGGRHVTHGRGEEEERVEALTRVHTGLWASSVIAE